MRLAEDLERIDPLPDIDCARSDIDWCCRGKIWFGSGRCGAPMAHPSPGRWPPSPRFAGQGVITKRLRHYPSPRVSGEKVAEGRMRGDSRRTRVKLTRDLVPSGPMPRDRERGSLRERETGSVERAL